MRVWRVMRGLGGVLAFGRRHPWIGSFLAAAALWLVTQAVAGQGGGALLVAALAFSAFFVVVGIGQMFVITLGPGNVDLSIPATINLGGAVAMAQMAQQDARIALGVAAALACGVVVGSVNYGLIRVLGIPPIIATLSTSFVVQSCAIVYGRGLRVKPPTAFADFATGNWGFVPLVAWVAVGFAAVMTVVLTRTAYGQWVLATGQNPRAARLAGVPVEWTRFVTYALCGLCAALAGTLLAGFSGGSSLNMGEEYLLASIAVVVIGGTSIAGGFSNVPGIWGAALFLYLLVAMLNTLGAGAGVRLIMTGLIIIGLVALAGQPRPGR